MSQQVDYLLTTYEEQLELEMSLSNKLPRSPMSGVNLSLFQSLLNSHKDSMFYFTHPAN